MASCRESAARIPSISEIIAYFRKNGVSGTYHKLTADDYIRLVELMQ
jgi:hypothetical protein